jgi:hypothetical protein
VAADHAAITTADAVSPGEARREVRLQPCERREKFC